MSRHEKITVILLAVALLALTAAYIYGVGTQWEAMLARPVRTSYFFSDLAVLYPLGIAAIVGMARNTRWGRKMLLLTLGAFLFDTAHQVFYLFRDNYFGLPLALAALLLGVVAAFTIFGYRAVSHNTEQQL